MESVEKICHTFESCVAFVGSIEKSIFTLESFFEDQEESIVEDYLEASVMTQYNYSLDNCFNAQNLKPPNQTKYHALEKKLHSA